MTVFPVTVIRLSAIFSRSRFCREVSVGAKWYVARWPVNVRLPSSGHGELKSPVRRPAFYVTHRYPLVKRRQARRHGGGGIAMHQHHVGFKRLQHRLQPFKDAAGDLGQPLPRLHDVEIVVRDNREKVSTPDRASPDAARSRILSPQNEDPLPAHGPEAPS